MDGRFEVLVRQGFETVERIIAEHPEITEEDRQALTEVEACRHPDLRIMAIVSECPECGRHWTRVVESPDQRMIELTKQIHQGKVGIQVVLASDEDLTDEDRGLLSSISPCPHNNLEEYECSCTKGKRWRCKSCGLAADSPDVFKRLGGK